MPRRRLAALVVSILLVLTMALILIIAWRQGLRLSLRPPPAPSMAIVAAGGWLMAVLLAMGLLVFGRKWKTAFADKEWVLSPTNHISELDSRVGKLTHVMDQSLHHLAKQTAHLGNETRRSATTVDETRAELSILRTELEAKHQEINALRLGYEFHARRPLLKRMIAALDIIEQDVAAGRDPATTLEGVRSELWECLEDNHVIRSAPAPGVQFTEAPEVDRERMQTEPTNDEQLKGTIIRTNRPAYVFSGPEGNKEVLVHAEVRVYV